MVNAVVTHYYEDSLMTSIWIHLLAAAALGYGLGSIPFGLVLTKIAGGGDLRNVGSGNIGATNVLRTGRKGLAALTLALDLLKGFVAVWVSSCYFPGFEAVAAASAFFGHIYPVWLRFEGGKGVATYAGIMFGLIWQAGLVYAAVWIITLLVSRISSAAGLAAAISAPIAAYYFGRLDYVALLLACSLIVVWKHRANIERLLAGTEPRVGSKAG